MRRSAVGIEAGNASNPYKRLYDRRIADGCSVDAALQAVAEAYLEGRPDRRGRQKVSAAERHAAFWSEDLWITAPTAALSTEVFVLAFTQYLQQDQTSVPTLLRRLATDSPLALQRAVRYSLVFVRRDSARWREIDALDPHRSGELGRFLNVCDRIDREQRNCLAEAHVCREAMGDMTPLEMLAYASLFAFEQLLPTLAQMTPEAQLRFESGADAISRLLAWTIARSPDEAFQITEVSVALSMRRHLVPFLFPTPDEPADEELYVAFKRAVVAQVEAHAVRSGSVVAFAFDDELHFEVVDGELRSWAKTSQSGDAWRRNGRKMDLLHGYWFLRAFEEFAASDLGSAPLGTSETDIAKLLAHLRARRDLLQLNEIYGMDAAVLADSGVAVDLFVALRTLELLTSFFALEFAQPFLKHLESTGDWRAALHALALGGVREDAFHIRFPLTWADRRDKIRRLQQWTTSDQFPDGNVKVAEAMIDFWTFDLSSHRDTTASRDMPELHERPILRLGRCVFQLPWMLAAQNNATAAINNLRRLGSRRSAVKDETRRIESRLSERLVERGFAVIANYQPVRSEVDDPGEVDVVCARDGHLWVLELKSTFVRKSLEEAWRHRTTTLRKAAAQLRRKMAAVIGDLAAPDQPLAALGLGFAAAPTVHAWIVDTSLEYDHDHIDGFLKVSLQEVLIALRDDHHLLIDPEILTDDVLAAESRRGAFGIPPPSTLYPAGFDGPTFARVVESGSIWAGVMPPTA